MIQLLTKVTKLSLQEASFQNKVTADAEYMSF